MADKKMIKIIQIDGRRPRKAGGLEKEVYPHQDHQVTLIDKDGKESTAFFAVFELPEAIAHQKISGASYRYVPFMCGDVECKVASPKGSMQWVTFRETKFEVTTKNIFDPGTGAIKVDDKGNPIFVKTSVLKNSAGEVVECVPYRTETKEVKIEPKKAVK